MFQSDGQTKAIRPQGFLNLSRRLWINKMTSKQTKVRQENSSALAQHYIRQESSRDGEGEQNEAALRMRSSGRVAAGTSTSAGPQYPSDDTAPPCSVLKLPTAGYTLQKLSIRTFQMRKWNPEVRYLSYPMLAWEPQAQPASRKHRGTATHKLTRNEDVSVYIPVNKWYATKEIAPVTRKWAGWFPWPQNNSLCLFGSYPPQVRGKAVLSPVHWGDVSEAVLLLWYYYNVLKC